MGLANGLFKPDNAVEDIKSARFKPMKKIKRTK